jgi:hypothetical protein
VMTHRAVEASVPAAVTFTAMMRSVLVRRVTSPAFKSFLFKHVDPLYL